MGQFDLQAAATPPPIPVTNDQKVQWNGLLDYIKQKGLQGSPALDNKNTALGQQLMEEYRAQNPHFNLTYDQVPQIQQGLQDYRNTLVKQWQANPKVAPGVKSPNDIMSGISPVDGWLGSKTSSYKFPSATLVNSDGTAQNYGVNTAAYDAAIAKLKSGK